MSDAVTFYFEELIPDYDTFNSLCNELGIPNTAEDTTFKTYLYNVLNRYFYHQNVRYEEPGAFITQFGNVLLNKYYKYKKYKEVIDAMYNLTLDEMRIVTDGLTNVANNPNDAPEDPLKPLEYISMQTYSYTKENKLQAYLRALDAIPTLNIDELIRGNERDKNEIQFIELFMNVQPNQFHIFRRKY